ncbi:MAG: helix-hairpin-helix domain-containing protein [Woeseia sp.]|jgi:competence protein ComEA
MNKNQSRLLTCLAVLLLPMLALAGPVNVNSANAESISSELKGVGLKKAQAIVEYRKVHGPFKSVDDLALVKGIGARTVEINRQNILLDGAQDKSRK